MKLFTSIVCLYLLCGSCATYSRCVEKYGNAASKDTTYEVIEKLIPYEIYLPADTVETIIDCSHIYKQVQLDKSKEGYLQSEVSQRASGKVSVKTHIVNRYIHDTLRFTDSVMVVNNTITMSEPTTWHKKGFWIAAGLATLFLLILILLSKKL